MNIIQAIKDKNLFSDWFDKNSWDNWFVFLKTLFSLPMSEDEKEVAKSFTGRTVLPAGQIKEGWLVVGRRGGKSFIVALIAVYLACFRDYKGALAKGERGHVMILANDRKQSRVIFRYVSSLLTDVPILNEMVERVSNESIELSNGINIEIHTTNFRSVRGYTVVAALCDEIAFWRSDESTNPDKEILSALRPAMATIPNSLLLGLSSPYAKRGVLYENYKRNYGDIDSSVLVWQADTRSMNPTVPIEFINNEYERDSASASAEYGASFRNDIDSFITREIVEEAVMNESVLPYNTDYEYLAFTDPSGGSRDSFTLAISHIEKDETKVIDCLLEFKPPFSPEKVVKEMCDVLKTYRISNVAGDRYGGEFPRELFSKQGIGYQLSEYNRSELYLEMLPMLTCGKVALVNNTKLINQIVSLERRTARTGKDSVDHPPGGHDDLANAVAGALHLAAKNGSVDMGAFLELNKLFPKLESFSEDY